MWWKYLRIIEKNEGSTLPELIIALAVTAMLFAGLAGMAAIAVQVKMVATEHSGADRELRHLYVFFQKQIRQSEKIYTTQNGLCLEDMESRHLGYLNYYTHDKKTKVLYRHKITKTGIAQGTKTQIATGVRCFSMCWDQKSDGVQVQVVMEDGKGFEATVAFKENMEVLPIGVGYGLTRRDDCFEFFNDDDGNGYDDDAV